MEDLVKRRARALRWYHKHRDQARAIQKRWAEANPDKVAERGKRWRESNRERQALKLKTWADNNPAKVLEKGRRWYARNKEKAHENAKRWREKFPERYSTSYRKWAKANPGAVRHNTSKRRAACLRAMPHWLTDDQVEQIKEKYRACPIGYQVDHIIPLRGKIISGLHTPENLQYLPAIENRRKGNKF